MVLLLSFFLMAPAAVLYLCKKIPFFNRIGPVLLLYIIGIIVGNVPFLPDARLKLQEILSSAIIPIAIPLLLFNSDFRKFSFRKSLMAFMCGVIAVVITVVAGFFIFRNYLGTDAAKIGGMLTGVYTGGTPNLAALKLVLGVKDETYILLNAYDMIVSFFYLLFLMTFGIRLFRRFLPHSDHNTDMERHIAKSDSVFLNDAPSAGGNLFQIFKAVGLSLFIFLFSAGVAILASGKISLGMDAVMNWKYFMAVLILSLTSLGIGASFVPAVRRLDKSYDAGMYLVYIFSIVVASMADLSNLNFRGGLYMFLFILFVIFLSLVIQAVLSKIFRIDADTMIISSVSLINSPPMVPMMVAALGNKNVMITGLSIGIIGYAVGNYLGFLLSELLALF